MYSSRPSYAVKDSRRARPLAFLFGSKFKQQMQIAREKMSLTEADRDKKPASRTLILSPATSSRYLLNHDVCSSSSSSFLDSAPVLPDFELDPVPEMIQIDHKRFHFEDAGSTGGPFDLRSSASICRPKENSFTPDTSQATWARFDSLHNRQHEHGNRNDGMMMIKQREIGCSRASSTSSWSDKDNYLINTNNKAGLKESGDHVVDESTDTSAHLLNPSSSSSSRSIDQVVDLRVALHCRGCERKLRKHLSRMKGVTSFSIDFTAKKVTVVGDVTPLDVLSRISKVKNAQIWS